MHQCKRCGKDTDHYFLCEDCIETEMSKPIYIDIIKAQAKMNELWEKEVDAYHAAHGY